MIRRRVWGVREGVGLAVAGLVLASAACSVILNHDSTQCESDSDCAKFGSHPYCSAGVCVTSGLGPPACVYFAPPQTPQQSADFLNQCSFAACGSFDDCKRLGVCGDAGPSLVPPPDASTTTSSASASDAGVSELCMDPANGRATVVYMSGASTWPPLISKLAPIVLGTPGGPTPVFQTTSSCAAVDSVFNGTHMVDPKPGSALSKYATYYRADGTAVPCVLGQGGVSVDIGASDIFSTSCDGFPAASPDSFTNDTTGAIQAVVFIVPGDSLETTISAEAAREVFGIAGNDGGAAPWTDPTRILVRNAGAGSQQLVSRAISVPANQFWGTDQGTATNLVNTMKLFTLRAADPAIGFVSVSSYDGNRRNLNALAFKASGQDCAYLPDSTSQASDKQNVRDGHYPIWGPIHFLTKYPPVTTSPATTFLNIVAVTQPSQNVVDAFIASSLVPTCAMKVARSTELGPLAAYSPSFQCGCYFESKVGTPSANCQMCANSSMCPAERPQCNFGFCELK